MLVSRRTRGEHPRNTAVMRCSANICRRKSELCRRALQLAAILLYKVLHRVASMEATTTSDQAFGRQRLIVKQHHGMTEYRVIAPRPWQHYAGPALGVIAMVRIDLLFARFPPYPPTSL